MKSYIYSTGQKEEKKVHIWNVINFTLIFIVLKVLNNEFHLNSIYFLVKLIFIINLNNLIVLM